MYSAIIADVARRIIVADDELKGDGIMMWENFGQAFCLGVYAGTTVFGFLTVLVVLTGLTGFIVNLIAGIVRGGEDKG